MVLNEKEKVPKELLSKAFDLMSQSIDEIAGEMGMSITKDSKGNYLLDSYREQWTDNLTIADLERMKLNIKKKNIESENRMENMKAPIGKVIKFMENFEDDELADIIRMMKIWRDEDIKVVTFPQFIAYRTMFMEIIYILGTLESDYNKIAGQFDHFIREYFI